MTTDNGGAPCVKGDLLSLAICKPRIRRTAARGSFIFGFGGKRYHERLIYIAQVTDKKSGQDYYCRREFSRRPDCIYRVEKNRPVRKAGARYHTNSDHRRKDVGFHFENAFVLLSKNFRYLGREGTNDYKQKYAKLEHLIENLKRGHRRYLSPGLRKDLLALKTQIWNKYRRKKVGVPTDADFTRICNRECPSISC